MRWQAVAVGLALSLPVAPLAGQGVDYTLDRDDAQTDDRPVSAEQALEQSRKVYGPPPPRGNCPQDRENTEIVVCAEEDQSEFRVQSTAELDPDGPAALDDGVPRAPDFRPPPCVPSLLTMCSKFGGAAPPPVMVDFSALPEAPEGSDADRIAKGLKPKEVSGD